MATCVFTVVVDFQLYFWRSGCRGSSATEAAPVVPVQEREKGATESISRKKIAEPAEKITPAQIEAAHRAMQILAGYCDGAKELDGAGFSRIDVWVGHSLAGAVRLTAKQAVLAAKIARKYKRQLSDDLLAQL